MDGGTVKTTQREKLAFTTAQRRAPIANADFNHCVAVFHGRAKLTAAQLFQHFGKESSHAGPWSSVAAPNDNFPSHKKPEAHLSNGGVGHSRAPKERLKRMWLR